MDAPAARSIGEKRVHVVSQNEYGQHVADTPDKVRAQEPGAVALEQLTQSLGGEQSE